MKERGSDRFTYEKLGDDSDPNNPFASVDPVYHRTAAADDVLAQRQKAQADRAAALTGVDPEKQFQTAQEEADALKQDPLGLRGKLLEKTDGQIEAEDRDNENLVGATSEERAQSRRFKDVKEARRDDSKLRYDGSLTGMLKVPEHQLNPEQRAMLAQVRDLQRDLRTYDEVRAYHDALKQEYARNGWCEDSHWYGLDDKKFLADVRGKGDTSPYEDSRVLDTIDKVKKEDPLFKPDSPTLTAEERKAGQAERDAINTQEKDTQRKMVERLQPELAKLEAALAAHHGEQGWFTGAADGIAGQVGAPGGRLWGVFRTRMLVQ